MERSQIFCRTSSFVERTSDLLLQSSQSLRNRRGCDCIGRPNAQKRSFWARDVRRPHFTEAHLRSNKTFNKKCVFAKRLDSTHSLRATTFDSVWCLRLSGQKPSTASFSNILKVKSSCAVPCPLRAVFWVVPDDGY